MRRMLQTLIDLGLADNCQPMSDSNCVRRHASAAGGKRDDGANELCRSRGGLTRTIPFRLGLARTIKDTYRLYLTGGEASVYTAAEPFAAFPASTPAVAFSSRVRSASELRLARNPSVGPPTMRKRIKALHTVRLARRPNEAEPETSGVVPRTRVGGETSSRSTESFCLLSSLICADCSVRTAQLCARPTHQPAGPMPHQKIAFHQRSSLRSSLGYEA